MKGKRKKISFFIFSILKILNKISFYFFKYDFLIYLPNFIINSYYKKILILNKEIKFFIPNDIIDWRIKTFFQKEPETLEWIDSFDKRKEKILWDIGANIGLYSIYAALKYDNIIIYSFEPSTSNLRTLSRNISINKLENKINIVPFALTNKENKFLLMNESEFTEGGALHTFGENFDFEGNILKKTNNYSIYGTTVNYLVSESIIPSPDYIKIDVDGIEHLILNGADKVLGNKKLKSIAIEINENFKTQYEEILSIMKKFDFVMVHKKNNPKTYIGKFANSFNYLFERI